MDTWALVDGLFFYKDQLESPTNKTAQGHLKEITLGELLEVWLGGPKRDIFLTKKKKILLSSMEKGRFCVFCNRHIRRVHYKEVGPVVCGSRLLVWPGTGYTPSKKEVCRLGKHTLL